MNQQTTKVWISECGNYMIRWSRECLGVSVTPHYHAMVRIYGGPDADATKIWAFAGRRGPYKKLHTAMEACEYNFKIWTAGVQIAKGEFKGRADRLRAIDVRARVGSGVSRGRLFHNIPVWVRNHEPAALRIIHAAVFPCKKSNDQDDQPEVSMTSESCSLDSPSTSMEPSELTAETSGLASTATVADEFATPPTETPSKDTSSRRGTRARSATAPAKGTKKPSKRCTTKKSKSTEPTETASTAPSKSAVKRSKGSAAKKGKRSAG